tara:strand:- start:148 stop:573 length:426 start_codon:yes stop_codon:yes gene_type:complete
MPARSFTLGPNQKITIWNSNPYHTYGKSRRGPHDPSKGEFNTPAQARKEVSKLHKQGVQAMAVKNPGGGIDIYTNFDYPFIIPGKNPAGVKNIKSKKKKSTPKRSRTASPRTTQPRVFGDLSPELKRKILATEAKHKELFR